MSTTRPYTTTNTSNTKTYEDINDILKRVSNRTLEMKTNNVKLLNKIGSEMNNLLIKCQDIVRFCINDRNDFMKEVELIQFDFIQLGKKIDEQFTASNLDKSNQAQNEPNQTYKSNLNKLLNDSGSSPSDEDEFTKPTNIRQHYDLVIPDTCYQTFDLNTNKNFNNNLPQLMIRDTIDSNYDEIFRDLNRENNNRLETVSENRSLEEEDKQRRSVTKDVDVDETCLEEENILTVNKNLNRVNYLAKNSQSTPVAVKKKLQEHGLLDLTNSPNAHESPYKSQSIIKNANHLLNHKNKQFNSPIKYIQSKFIYESPTTIGSSSSSTSSKIKTPVKVILKTPTKSPSMLAKKTQNENTNSNLSESSTKEENEQNDSLDFSFEFREQFNKKNSKHSNAQPAKVTTNSSTSSNGSSMNQSKKSLSLNFNETATTSPNKKGSQLRPNAKRFKQLTMTQAFASQQNDTTLNKNNQSIKLKNGNKTDLEETCLPNDEILSNLKSIKVKDEPLIIEEVDFQDRTDDLSNANTDDRDPRRTKDLANEYFNDFDRPEKKRSDSPNFKHVQVVRKQDERKKLATSSCRECESYWNSVPEEMRPKRMEDSCRHRAKFQAPATPEHYWSIGFPTTQECIERGYGGAVAQSDKEDQIGKRPRRKRPLKLMATDQKNDGESEQEDYDFGP